MANRVLSKSRILSGWQCHKRLWLETHEPEHAVIDAETRRSFATGHAVGAVAQSLFADGVLIGHDGQLSDALAETERRVSADGPFTLFEATFRHSGVLIRCDVLIRDEAGRIRLIEVKASSKLKPYHLMDCAVQFLVLTGVGLRPDCVELAHVDSAFVYPGEERYDGLLAFEDVYDKVDRMAEGVARWIDDYKRVIEEPMPDIGIGPHCRNPFACGFLEFCTPPQPEYPVTRLPGNAKVKYELLERGIEDMRDIAPGFLHNENQERVRRITAEGVADLDPSVAEELGELAWPRYYLDFETVAFAVPVWEGTRPYQALPFQWSCHVEHSDGSLEHRDFLAAGDGPPMREFAATLVAAMDASGPVLVYTHYEATVLRNLASLCPEFAIGLAAIAQRIVDLHPITKAGYYHPDMLGSWSIKAVLPTIGCGLGYGDLGEIQDGGAASEAYLEIMDENTGAARRASLRKDLIEYCALDTMALVQLARFLESRQAC